MKKLIELDRKECVRTRESSDREGERTACLNPLYVRGVCFFFEGDEGGRNEGRKILPLLSGASVSNVALLLLSMLPRVRGGGLGGWGACKREQS